MGLNSKNQLGILAGYSSYKKLKEFIHHQIIFFTRIQFQKDTPSFDLVLERPMEKLEFSQIRLPYPLNLILPLKSGIANSVKTTANLISANTILPTCQVEGKALQTFDNRLDSFLLNFINRLLNRLSFCQRYIMFKTKIPKRVFYTCYVIFRV